MTYNSPTLTNYNSNPPADDGTEVEANRGKWQTHLDKIGDPLRTYAEAIDAAVAVAVQDIADTPVAPRGYIDGFVTSNGTDTAHDIDIAAGICRDSANLQTLITTAVLTKQIDVDWAEGTNDGGFPSGLTLAIDTWYHVFLIWKADGTVDAGFDTALTATNLLTDATAYTRYRRIGSVLTDGSSNIISFTQDDGEFFWSQPIQDVFLLNPGTGPSNRTLSVPLGLSVRAKMAVNLQEAAAASARLLLLSKPQSPSPAVSSTSYTLRMAISGEGNGAVAEAWASTSSQVQTDFDSSGANLQLTINTLGWLDPRGANA